MGFKINWDALGVATSVACAIHCALLPLFLSGLTVFGIEWLSSVAFEAGMIILAFLIGVYSLSHGFRKHHHSWTPLIAFTAGFLFLVAKEIWHEKEILFLIIAVTGIIIAHILNYRLCRKANHCHATDCTH